MFTMMFSLLLVACGQQDIQSYVVKTGPDPGVEDTMPLVAEVKENEQTDIEEIQETSKAYTDLQVGEEFFFEGEKILISKENNGIVTVKHDDESFDLTEGTSHMTDDLEIRLVAVKKTRRESAGIVKYYFQFGNSVKKLEMGEKDQRQYQDRVGKYTIVLDFVGKRDNQDVAVFLVNEQHTKPLGEKEDFYFKDGSYILIAEIMSGTARVVESTTFDIEVKS